MTSTGALNTVVASTKDTNLIVPFYNWSINVRFLYLYLIFTSLHRKSLRDEYWSIRFIFYWHIKKKVFQPQEFIVFVDHYSAIIFWCFSNFLPWDWLIITIKLMLHSRERCDLNPYFLIFPSKIIMLGLFRNLCPRQQQFRCLTFMCGYSTDLSLEIAHFSKNGEPSVHAYCTMTYVLVMILLALSKLECGWLIASKLFRNLRISFGGRYAS